MKKALIAGAASVALAAMPVLGAFADADLTDTLSIEVQDNCALTYKSTAHTNGTNASWSSNTLSAELAAGTADEALGSSSFNVICNNQAGWHVTADATSLSATVDSNNRAIPNGSTPNTDGSVYHFTPAKANNTDTTFIAGGVDAGNVVTMDAATNTTGKDFNISYTITIGATQAADTYEGTIGYTLVKGPAA